MKKLKSFKVSTKMLHPQGSPVQHLERVNLLDLKTTLIRRWRLNQLKCLKTTLLKRKSKTTDKTIVKQNPVRLKRSLIMMKITCLLIGLKSCNSRGKSKSVSTRSELHQGGCQTLPSQLTLEDLPSITTVTGTLSLLLVVQYMETTCDLTMLTLSLVIMRLSINKFMERPHLPLLCQLKGPGVHL